MVSLQRFASSAANPATSAVLRVAAAVERGQCDVVHACPLRAADQ